MKISRIVLIVLASILLILVLWFVGTTVFYSITHPTVSPDFANIPIEKNVVTAKQIEQYLCDVIQKNDKLDQYDLVVGSIDMKIDAEHKGEITVIFVEKDNKKPRVVFAYLDTNEGVISKLQDYGRESKLYPGIINLREWSIDSTDAVLITKDFFKNDYGFRYDEIWIYTYNDYLADSSKGEERWLVYLTDKQNDIRYSTRIDPYSGEVISHSVN